MFTGFAPAKWVEDHIQKRRSVTQNKLQFCLKTPAAHFFPGKKRQRKWRRWG
jgi:hypothetical protein